MSTRNQKISKIGPDSDAIAISQTCLQIALSKLTREIPIWYRTGKKSQEKLTFNYICTSNKENFIKFKNSKKVFWYIIMRKHFQFLIYLKLHFHNLLLSSKCINVCMHLFRHHKKMFKIQIKRMATIRYYIIK